MNLPSSSKRGCARQAACRTSQGRPHMAGTGAFHGASRKAAGPSCVGGFLPRVLQWPRRTGTRHAEPSCCPPLLSLCVLSSAPAHASTGTMRVQALTANLHKASVTHGSNASTPHPAPCGWASFVSCPGTGFAETLESIQCILAQYK